MKRPNFGLGLLLVTLLCPRSSVVAADEPLSVRVTDVRIQREVPQTLTVVGLSKSDRGNISNGQFLFVKLEPRDVDASQSATQSSGGRRQQAARKSFQPQAVLPDAQDKVVFTVPDDQGLGDYNLGIVRSPADALIDSVPVTVVRSPTPPVVLNSGKSVSKRDESFEVTLLGSGFSVVSEDNVLVFDGVGEIAGSQNANPPNTHQLKFLVPNDFRGAQNVRVRVGDQYSQDPPIPMLLSRNWGIGILVAAFVATGVLFLVVTLLASRGLKPAVIAGESQNVLTTFLLDAETNSLSLSKFQFYSWTAAAIFGYLYMLLVRALIQGHFDLPDLPTNLPGLLLISSSTSVVAKGITTVRGPKGAGGIQPSLADFVTVGGVVSIERFQFFVWTVLGIFSFLFLIGSQSPDQFHGLPSVPQAFLYMMGVSSSGYLGGKLVRKAGPVIDSITGKATRDAAGKLTNVSLDIKGRCLSREATFWIQGKELTFELKKPQGAVASPVQKDAMLELVAADAQMKDPTLASELVLTILNPLAWLKEKGEREDLFGPVTLLAAEGEAAIPTKNILVTISNPDGQMAEWDCKLKAW
jgi:hypothetical protein